MIGTAAALILIYAAIELSGVGVQAKKGKAGSAILGALFMAFNVYVALSLLGVV